MATLFGTLERLKELYELRELDHDSRKWLKEVIGKMQRAVQ